MILHEIDQPTSILIPQSDADVDPASDKCDRTFGTGRVNHHYRGRHEIAHPLEQTGAIVRERETGRKAHKRIVEALVYESKLAASSAAS